ncbi:MAG TPA: TetR/AcrR family transcriptional regulator C-terminal domain-containing protein [Streptosporangiaceae bacterium]
MQPAGPPDRRTALTFSLIYDYTVGFALSDRGTVNEQPVQDAAIRLRLHKFLRSLPPGQFPALVAIGEHVWADNRDERFIASVQTLLGGIEAAQRPAGQ